MSRRSRTRVRRLTAAQQHEYDTLLTDRGLPIEEWTRRAEALPDWALERLHAALVRRRDDAIQQMHDAQDALWRITPVSEEPAPADGSHRIQGGMTE